MTSSELSLLIKSERTCDLDSDDGYGYRTDIEAFLMKDIGSTEAIGKIKARKWHVVELVNEKQYVEDRLSDAMDSEDQEGYDAFCALIDLVKDDEYATLNHDVLEIERIFISPEFRNQGLGSKMLATFILRQYSGVKYVLLQPSPTEGEKSEESIKRLKHWYLSLGFKSIPGHNFMYLDMELIQKKLEKVLKVA